MFCNLSRTEADKSAKEDEDTFVFKPLQRLCRYPLYLERLVRHSDARKHDLVSFSFERTLWETLDYKKIYKSI